MSAVNSGSGGRGRLGIFTRLFLVGLVRLAYAPKGANLSAPSVRHQTELPPNGCNASTPSLARWHLGFLPSNSTLRNCSMVRSLSRSRSSKLAKKSPLTLYE